MKISEIMNITNLTRKAINYYEEEGLINPAVNPENNYREYSQSDADILAQISILRQFDVPIKDIRAIISDPGLLKEKLEQHLTKLDDEVNRLEKSKNVLRACIKSLDSGEIELSKLTKQLSDLNKALELDERGREGFMKKQLQRIFPGNFGRMMTIYYSPFLNDPVDTPKKEEAWYDIVKFLDEVETVDYPQEMNDIYKNITDEVVEIYEKHTSDQVKKWLTITDEGIVAEREQMLSNIRKINQNSENQSQLLKVSNISKSFNGSLSSIGYHEKFTNNLKILSRDYRTYTENMQKFSASLNIKINGDGKIEIDGYGCKIYTLIHKLRKFQL
ncbi:MAG: MerR family transcriptional regulator [Bacillota bacterium]|nr:MerR family transcriptional regulator [Bacillota bacterium]